MKKRHLLGTAASGALLLAANAHAQSSVTLYGVLDAGIAYVHNAATSSASPYGSRSGNVFKLGSGNTYGDRWGVRGREDLGGGLAAIFQLESGFNIGTGASGQGGTLFGRKAIVGLSSDTWGTVTLGRQYDPVVDLVQAYTEDAYFGGTFGTPGDVDNYDNSLRVNNSVKYASPVISGLQVEALYGFGGVAGTTGSGQTYSFAGAYANGPVGIAAGYLYANGRNATNGAAWSSSAGSLFQSVINDGFASAKALSSARVSGQYVFGPVTAGAAYSHTEYLRDALSDYARAAKFNNSSVFVNYRAAPSLLLGLGYNYTLLTWPAKANYKQFNVGVDYALSKRTSLYALAAYQKANGHTLNTAGQQVAAQASIGDYGVSSGTDTQVLTAIGLRSRF